MADVSPGPPHSPWCLAMVIRPVSSCPPDASALGLPEIRSCSVCLHLVAECLPSSPQLWRTCATCGFAAPAGPVAVGGHDCPPGWWASAVRFSFPRLVEGAAGQGARRPVHLLRPALAPGEGRRRSVPVLLNLLLSVLPTLLPLVRPFQLVGTCSVWEGKLWWGG